MFKSEVALQPQHLLALRDYRRILEDGGMSDKTVVRWFVIFIKPDTEGDTDGDSMDFPDLDFWHEDGESARREAERVLCQLHQQGDSRTWKAVGHPDPIEVARGNHPVDQWIVTSRDVPHVSGVQ